MALKPNVLSKYVKKNDGVLVGVSGGADSMCLLHLLKEYSKDVEIKILAVHVNHNLRDQEAKRDEDFVCDYCKKNEIPFRSVHIKTKEYAEKNGKTIEQAGRELRYDAFERLKKEEGLNKVLIAHHSSDQAETVLMHIARGSSIKGASGMSDIMEGIARPLLNVSKEEVVLSEFNSAFF